MREVPFWRGCAVAALLSLLASGPAQADRWFGSIYVGCGSFGDCLVSPEMPDPPGNSASLQLQRSGKANAPLEIFMHVNKPVEGGAPVRLEFGAAIFDLKPGEVVTRRQTSGSQERVTGNAGSSGQQRVAATAAIRQGERAARDLHARQ